MITKASNILTRITGSKAGANTEQQTLNLVLCATIVFVSWGVVMNFALGLTAPNFVLVPALSILIIGFYRSRVKNDFRWGWIPLAVLSYLGLLAIYLLNDGSKGPVLIVSVPILISLMAIVKPKVYPLIILLHLSLFIALGIYELFRPDHINNTYGSDQERIIDNIVSFVVSILFFSVILGFIRNILVKQDRELRTQREQLKVQNNQLKNIFSVLSHDLRAPLGNVSGYLEVMTSSELGEEQRSELERELMHSTRSAATILEDLLIWSKVQLEGGDTLRAKVDLSWLFQRARMDVRAFAERKDVFVRVDSNDLGLNCNKEQMSIVLRNLLHNAIKYSPRGSTVNLLAEKFSEEETTIQVIDSGIGMSTVVKEKLFDQVASGSPGTEGEQGAGIGLILTGQLIKQNGGAIHVSSTEGKGTTFTVTFR